MYLASIADGSPITLRVCADRYGVAVGTVHAVVQRIREERRAAEGQALAAMPEQMRQGGS
jgi:hypothetical protein